MKKKPTKKTSSKAASVPPVPQGYKRLPPECYLKPEYLIWSRTKRCWEIAGVKAKSGFEVMAGRNRYVICLDTPKPKFDVVPEPSAPVDVLVDYAHPYRSVQTSAIHPKKVEELREEQKQRQERIREAMRNGEGCVDPGFPQIFSGALGERPCPGGNGPIRVALMNTSQLKDTLCGFNPDNCLDAAIPGLTSTEQIVYRHYLHTMPDTDRQALYASGGLEAVRAMALRLARAALKPKSKPRSKTRVKPRAR